MKIFRWVLSNLLLLAVVWTFVYAYLNWDELKDDMPDSVNNLVARFQHDESPEAVVSSDEPSVKEHGDQSGLDDHVGAKEPEVVVTEETEAVLNQMPADQNEGQTVGEPEAGDVAPLSADQPILETQEQEAISVQVPEVAQMPAPQQAMETEEPAQKQELGEAVRSELIQAREAFWNRDLAKAESLYSELTTKQPDYPDFWGEMGNVYLAQNKVKEAADAYYKAAELLIDEGRLRQVGQLMGVIHMADPDKAMVLDKKIQALYQQQ
jgi:tetratricopeptide (TPR) repeat protein